MRTCALSEDILLTVEKPARYIGGEIGSIDPAAGADVRFVCAFRTFMKSECHIWAYRSFTTI